MISTRRLVAGWCVAVMVAALAVVALALLLGGGAPQPAPPGLPDIGRLPAWLGAIVAVPLRFVGVVAIGFALIGGSRILAERAVALWVLLTIVQLALVRWELGNQVRGLDNDRFRAGLVQLALLAVVLLCWQLGTGALARRCALVAAVAATLPVALVGHARSAEHPLVASVALAAHIVGAALWVGGLAALAWQAATRTGNWAHELARYSLVALASVAVVVVSGLVAAFGHLDSPKQFFDSKYGAIITLKAVLLAGLAGAGWMQRRHVIRRLPLTMRGFVGLASAELATMAVAMALAAALARTPPPA